MKADGPVLSGPLVAESFARQELLRRPESPARASARSLAHRAFRQWWRHRLSTHGPASSPRAIHETAILRLLRILGYTPVPDQDVSLPDRVLTLALARPDVAVGVVTTAWGADLHHAWRTAVATAARTRAAWWLACNGGRLRVIDAARPYARRYVECDLEVAAADERAFALLWMLTRAGAVASSRPGVPSALDVIVEQSAGHQTLLCAALDDGVRDAHAQLVDALRAAPGSRSTDPPVPEQALTIVFRLLFLFYAEARGLAPMRHRVYRDSYSLAALSEAACRQPGARGLWDAARAAMRLAHAGCRVRGLRVTAYNGRLFSPVHAPLAERARVDDGVARAVLRRLSTRTAKDGRALPLPFGELGVEQLGAVYERLMDAVHDGHTTAKRGGDDTRRLSRKSSGTFYTPRSLTEFLVRRTLSPLTAGRDPDGILALRVLDPAMGSGAFLVAACRHLAGAYERALVAGRIYRASDFGSADRAGFRRLVAQRCLYGVDVNPMAVQLARLSLWLTTLAADRPLTFLDHRLQPGDSLLGASPADLARQPPGPGARRGRPRALPLLAGLDLSSPMRTSVGQRVDLSARPDDDVDTVRAKEAVLRALAADDAPLARWRRACDVWCAAWFWPRASFPGANVCNDLVAEALGAAPALPPKQRARLLRDVDAIASTRRFLHWPLTFPEVFADATGAAREDAGFDAVLGNPPWDMLRAEHGTSRADVTSYTAFVRESGLYVSGSDAHINRYQLFVERALDLLRPGGRLGLIVPWGLLGDTGASAVRHRLLERTRVDAVVAFDNRRAIFPIHRSVRFGVLTCTTGAATDAVATRPGETSADALDGISDSGTNARDFPLVLSRGALDTLSPGDRTFPGVRSAADLERLVRLKTVHPPLGNPAGWGAQFGRELNATDDRPHFSSGGNGYPVVEGKLLSPFVADVHRATWRLPRASPPAARRRLHFDRPRVAVRDVASAGNRLTLIAAVLPAGTATTHTVSCVRTPMPVESQHVLCALLNSLVANWYVRHWVSTHVTTAILHALPMPAIDDRSLAFTRLSALSQRCAQEGEEGRAYVELQAACARVYGLSPADLAGILDSFPLIDAGVRRAIAAAFARGGYGEAEPPSG